MSKVLSRELTEKDKELLRECIKIADESVKNGNHPFGCLLADKDGNILIRMENGFSHGGSAAHAETLCLLEAGRNYKPEFLKDCTLYSNFEPCAMCTGALYWTNVGTLVFGATEEDLLKFTGDNEENPTLSLSSRDVIERGQKEIVVVGPVEDEKLLAEICEPHIEFWK